MIKRDDLENAKQCDRSDFLQELQSNAKTIIVNRMPLTFDEEECSVINFTDISAYVHLK